MRSGVMAGAAGHLWDRFPAVRMPRRPAGVPVRRGADNDALAGWLAAAAQGDQAAFRELYVAASPRLMAVVLRLVPSRAVAEELLQEAFLAIWANASAYSRARSQPMTWMTTIVRNRCFDLLRRPVLECTVAHEHEDGDPFDRFKGPARDPLDIGIASESRTEIERALSRLPGHSRQALTLAYCHGMSHTELAQHLGVPVGTAKSWVRRGLEALRDVRPKG